MLTPEAAEQVWEWLETLPHEVVVECVRTPRGVAWGAVLSIPGHGCAPRQVRTAPWSMHTHPRACYKRNGAYYGWPSGADCVTFLHQQGTEHWVCALEGIYILRSTEAGRQQWAQLDDEERVQLQEQWDLASDRPDLTPEAALAELQGALRGWIDLEFVPWRQ